jgi:hypothetical protein
VIAGRMTCGCLILSLGLFVRAAAFGVAMCDRTGTRASYIANELLRLCSERDEIPQPVGDFIIEHTQ